MPLLTAREQVQAVYAEAYERRWVLPCFNAENLTTTEAILSAATEYGQAVAKEDLPIIVGITNKYLYRPQSMYYTHTRRWEVGLRLFLEDLKVLTSLESPFGRLRVMVHLDHVQWDLDADLLDSNLNEFSSIMYDASSLPYEENIKRTAAFVERHGNSILIEGACDEIGEPGASAGNVVTAPDIAERFYRDTGVDLVVANLGTEHRAPTAVLRYDGQVAREIARRIGQHLCLHGASSVALTELSCLFDDGICKANVWTALERDSSSALLRDMLENAAKAVGTEHAEELVGEGLLGPRADHASELSLSHYTTTYRQGIVFRRMKEIVTDYLRKWYM